MGQNYILLRSASENAELLQRHYTTCMHHMMTLEVASYIWWDVLSLNSRTSKNFSTSEHSDGVNSPIPMV
jgi:hypothetical protein